MSLSVVSTANRSHIYFEGIRLSEFLRLCEMCVSVRHLFLDSMTIVIGAATMMPEV